MRKVFVTIVAVGMWLYAIQLFVDQATALTH